MFRLAKGYTQQEIAARLGAPEEITPRFDSAETAPIKAGAYGSFRTGLGCGRLFRCFAVLYLRFGGAGRAVDGGMRLLRSLHPSADAQLCQISAQCPCGCRGAYCSSVCCGASVDNPKGGTPPVSAVHDFAESILDLPGAGLPGGGPFRWFVGILPCLWLVRVYRCLRRQWYVRP